VSLVRPVAMLNVPEHQGWISQRFDGQFSWEPAGYLKRRSPVNRGKRTKFSDAVYYSHLHLAIDYICVVGTPVRAMKSGVVVAQGKDVTGAYIQWIRLRRGAKYDVLSLSYHLKADSYKVRVGQTVKRGQTVALSGNTGWSTGPHLHQELIRVRRGAGVVEAFAKGLRVDPQPFINGLSLKEIAP